MIALSTASCAGAPSDRESSELPGADTARSALYQQPGTSFWTGDPVTIPVCWATPAWATEKQWVEDSIQATWGAQTELVIRFEPTCPTNEESRRVRLIIGNHPDSSNLGATANTDFTGPATMTGPGGVGIRFWFRPPPGPPSTKSRVEYLAVHEFGHVLGFSHEQDQAGPGSIACRQSLCQGNPNYNQCMADAARAEGGVSIGPYDSKSIMNYCGPHLNAVGVLSDLDGVGARKIYGKRSHNLDEHEPAASAVSINGSTLNVFARAPGGNVVHQVLLGDQAWPSIPDDLGGNIIGTPVAVLANPHTIFVFAVGTDNAVWYTQWDLAVDPFPPYDRWQSLGGVVVGKPAVVVSPNERIDIFVRGAANDVHHKAMYSGQWVPSQLGWEPLGGYITESPTAVALGPNRIDVFVVGGGRDLYRKASDDWGFFGQASWEALGGWITAAPAVVSSAPGELDILVKGQSGRLYHKTFDGSTWRPSKTTYFDIGMQIIGTPNLVSWGPGRIDAFGQAPEGQLLHEWAWDQRDTFPPRGPRFSVPTEELGGWLYGSPVAHSIGPDTLHILGRDGNDRIVIRRWQAGWSDWISTNLVTSW